jgi:hypothetical protein
MTNLAIRGFLLFLLCAPIMGITIAQAQTVVGVKQGDVFEYDMRSFWTCTFMDTPPADLMELNQTEWLRVTVTEVSGSQIKMQLTTRYRNGTEVNSDEFCDIETGDASGGPPFIGANLGENDLIYPSASEPWFVHYTITRDYVNSQRETNYLKLEDIGNTSEVGEFSRIYEYYFDKSTGALVEYSYDFSYTGLTTIVRSKLIASNVWAIPEFPSLIILPVFMMITLFAVAIKKRLFHRPP